MGNLTKINITLSQSLNQVKETILKLSKYMQAIQDKIDNKKPAADKNKRENKSKTAVVLMEEPKMRTIPVQLSTTPRKYPRRMIPWIIVWKEVASGARKMGITSSIGKIKNTREDIKYNQQHLSLINTISNIIT